MELTREQFIEEIKALSAKASVFDVSSSDTGNVNLYMQGCMIKASEEDGINGEIIIYKPQVTMEVTIDFSIVEEITKQGNTYTLSFVNGLSDVDIEVSQ